MIRIIFKTKYSYAIAIVAILLVIISLYIRINYTNILFNMKINAIRTDDVVKLENISRLSPITIFIDKYKKKRNLLLYASYFDAAKCMRFLIDNGGDVNDTGFIPIFTQFGPFKMDYTVLQVGVLRRNLGVINILIKHNAKVEQSGYKGNTPLHYLCLKDESLGYFLDKLPDTKRNAFHNIDTNKKAIFKVLIDAGANVNAKNDYGTTPIELAVDTKEIGLIRILLESGADPRIRDKNGFDAFDYANGIKNPTVVKKQILDILNNKAE